MEGRRLALVVAVNQYDDPGLRDLTAPSADATALAEVLGDPQLGNFSVETIRNETAAEVAERVEAFTSDLRPPDFALMHFSCHGLKDESGELYLAAKNTKLSRLASTGLDAAFIDRLMRRSRSQQIVLLLDCCYGGAFQRGVVSRAGPSADVGQQFHQQALGGGRGRVVITASTAMEFAFEGADLAEDRQGVPSVFTGALVEGLRSGEADRDEDGRVSLSELYDFVYDEVKRRAPRQTPSKWEYGLQGTLFVAGTPRRRVRPRKPSEDLLELVRHGHASVRMSAVSELLRLVEGEDLALAAGARAVLAPLADDDSRRVSTAAREALDASRLRLPVESYDFGPVAQGAPAPVLSLEVEGPPLVAAAEVASSSAGLRATLRDRSLTVTLDTSVVGVLDGDVAVSSPAGGGQIHVMADVRGPTADPNPVLETAGADVTPAAARVPSGPGGPVDVVAEPSTVKADDSPSVDVGKPEVPVQSDDDGMPHGVRLALIASVIAVIAVAATASVTDDEGGGGSSTARDRYGPPSESFVMSRPWTLTVTSMTESMCAVDVSRAAGGGQIAATQGSVSDVERSEEGGQHTRAVHVTETGTFVLSWYPGDEDECRATVKQDGTATAQVVEAPVG